MVTTGLAKAIRRFPKMNCLVYDRMCKLKPSMSKKEEFRGNKTWAVDEFHSAQHSSSCKCNSKVVRKNANRLRNVNTVVCEQTFAWFRKYNTTFNRMQPLRHRVLFMNYSAHHNECVLDGAATHLSPMIRTA